MRGCWIVLGVIAACCGALADSAPGRWFTERFAQTHRVHRRRDERRIEPVVVQIRGGDYFPTRTIRFTPDDSGTAQCPISYEAFPGEQPIPQFGEQLSRIDPRACSNSAYIMTNCFGEFDHTSNEHAQAMPTSDW